MHMVWDDITILVGQARRGDRAAMGTLCERFAPMVYATAMTHLRNATEAEEVTQEAFLHCLRKLPQLREEARFAGWLRRIAQRLAINRYMRRGPVKGVEAEVLERTEAPERTPLDSIVKREQDRAVRAALARLKPLDRKTLLAFYVRGRSLTEMSCEFEVPVGTIKRRLHVARRRLRGCLENGVRGKRKAGELVC
jgi:RNA polymerase sigma-70 factor (ECF subfamily)